jgi:predicted ATPase/DNA-binding CsgD family transcriptional regulator
VGREADLAELAGLLATPACRLLTLVGPGGVGKTRLALRAAAEARAGGAFADGVHVVALQPLASADLLAGAVADAAGLAPAGARDPTEHLLAGLRGRAALLVLDNFEHLLEGAALLPRLLAAAPGVRLLVTSREALALQEEWRYPVQGLPYPAGAGAADPEGPEGPEGPEAYAAVRLFAERARRGRRGFSLAEEGAAVARVCRLVEGLPLALELAAAWTSVLSCAEIATDLALGLDVLATRLRDVPERHRSMRAVFDGSWARLDDRQRAALARLSVFRGGFRREAAEAVAGAAPATLAALVDGSLLRLEPGGRYQLHELLRQYAEERLWEAPEAAAAAEARHGAYFAGWLGDLLPRLLGEGQGEALATLGADRDNVRAAWRWAVARADAAALGAAAPGIAELSLWEGRFREGAGAFERAAAVLPEADPGAAPEAAAAQAVVLSQLGRFYIRLGRLEEAEAVLLRCRALRERLGGPPAGGVATDPVLSLCLIAATRGDYALALRLAETALRAGEAHGHVPNQQFAWDLRARAALHLGRLEEAQRHAERALALVDASGDRLARASLLTVLGSVAMVRQDYRLARTCFEANLTIREALGGRGALALAWNRLGQLALREGDPEQARRGFERALATAAAHGDPEGQADALIGLGGAATAAGAYGAAREHLRAALAAAAGRPFGIYLAALLAGAGELALRAGDPGRGRELLALALRHPAATHDVRERARRLLGDGPPPAGAPGSDRDLPALVQDVLAGLAVQAPPAAAPPAGGRARPAGPGPDRGLVEPLSERELEVLRLLAEGRSNREIADSLIIAVGTVKTHVHNVCGKLGAPTRGRAVARARELGLLAPHAAPAP